MLKESLSLLDTRFKKYQHANLGTLDIILDFRTIVATIFPNYTMSLSDSYLTKALRLQFKILGAPPYYSPTETTLHHQIDW